MMGRVEDKILIVEKFLDELIEVVPNSFELYINNIEKRLASQKAFENIIESVNDLAILIIKEKGFDLPVEDKRAFDILAKSKLISEDLAFRLKKAKGMRNFLVHRYDNINDEIVYDAISNEIAKDTKEFLRVIK